MLLPIIRGVRAEQIEADVVFDTSAIPALSIDSKLFGARELEAELRAALRVHELLPSGRFELTLSTRVRSPGAALSLLAELLRLTLSSSQDPEDEGVVCWGSVDFKGVIRAARGSFNVAKLAQDCGYLAIVLPRSAICSQMSDLSIEIIPCNSIEELRLISQDWKGALRSHPTAEVYQERSSVSIDSLHDISLAKLAIEVMIAGRHHTALIGLEGSGKTAIARCVRSLMPHDQSADLMCIESVAGSKLYHGTAAVRMPHNTTNRSSMLGASYLGEVTLAHRGVLVFDDAPMFAISIMRDVVAIMDRSWPPSIYQDGKTIEMPGDFTGLVLAKPCPCGRRPCRDTIDGRYRWIERADRLMSACAIRVDLSDSTEVDRDQSHDATRSRIEAARALISGARVSVEATIAALDNRTQASSEDRRLAQLISGASWSA